VPLRYDLTALVALGYAQAPDRFDEQLAEFKDLLTRIDFWPGGVPLSEALLANPNVLLYPVQGRPKRNTLGRMRNTVTSFSNTP
jgi:hypothetical protein